MVGYFFLDIKLNTIFSKSKSSRKQEGLYHVRLTLQKYFMHKTVNDLLTFTFENIPWYDQEYQVCVCSFYVLYYSLLQQGGGGRGGNQDPGDPGQGWEKLGGGFFFLQVGGGGN